MKQIIYLDLGGDVIRQMTDEDNLTDEWIVKMENIIEKLGYKKDRNIIDYPIGTVAQELIDRSTSNEQVEVVEYLEAYTFEATDIDGELTGEVVDVPEQPQVMATKYFIPKEYTIEILDVTAEYDLIEDARLKKLEDIALIKLDKDKVKTMKLEELAAIVERIINVMGL